MKIVKNDESKNTTKTKVVEIYQEGMAKSYRTITARVPANWSDEQVEEFLESHGTSLDRWISDEDEPEVNITQIKTVVPDDEDEINEDWSAE